MERCPSCWLPSRVLVSRRVDCGWPVVPRNGSSTDGPWSSTDGRGKHRCRMCRRQSRFHGLQIVENIVEVFDIQTSERLDTASVRRVTPAEFVGGDRDRSAFTRRARVTHVRHGVSSDEQESSRQRDCVSAWAPRYKRSVHLSSTSETTQMECGSSGSFLLLWFHRVFRRWSRLQTQRRPSF